MKFSAILMATFLANAMALAEDLPYLFFQPSGGGHSLALSYSSIRTEIAPIFLVTRITLTQTPLYFSYTYGLTNNHAIGFENNMGTDTISTTNPASSTLTNKFLPFL